MEAVIRRTEQGIIQIVPGNAACRRVLMTEFELIPSMDGTFFLTPCHGVDELEVTGMVDWLQQSMKRHGLTVHYRLN